MQAEQASAQPPLPNFSKPPPDRIPAFHLGPNLCEFQLETGGRVRDVVWVDEEDVQRVLATYRNQANVLPIFKEHREADGSFGAMQLEQNAQGGIDQVWALSADGSALVASGRYMFDSPELVTELRVDGKRHLVEIRSGSLVNKPARTASRPLLMSANMTMQPNKELVTSGRACLGSLGSLENTLKALGDSKNEKLKKAADLLAPHIGPAIAELQGGLEELDPNGTIASPSEASQPSAETLKMSAAATDAQKLGTEVLRLTGAASKDEALGIMEARQNEVVKLTTKLAELGVETGRLPAADQDKYAKYPPARLLGVINNSSAMNLSARSESEAPVDNGGLKDPEATKWATSAQSAVDGLFAKHGIKKGA